VHMANNDLDSVLALVGSRVDSGRTKKMRDFVQVFEFLVYFSLPQMANYGNHVHGVVVVTQN
jgi:hypothetical protein